MGDVLGLVFITRIAHSIGFVMWHFDSSLCIYKFEDESYVCIEGYNQDGGFSDSMVPAYRYHILL